MLTLSDPSTKSAYCDVIQIVVTALTQIGSRTAMTVHRLGYGMDVQMASLSISKRGNNFCRL